MALSLPFRVAGAAALAFKLGLYGGHLPSAGSRVLEGLPVFVNREPTRSGRLAWRSRIRRGATETVGAVIPGGVDPGVR